ncbi:hypothetical protein BDN70DRAFT_887120 [Pholiota conissans]|uniref:Uncharacterized protein n=1 Tax=Pholiota conissans TaxID=109636 RepID=A0A9P5YRH3_9AGAR|nr:hypothetical protein BDN70DRAFT_887120 [Pholiota conissans]
MICLGTTACLLNLFRKPPEQRLEITRSPLARYEDSATDDATRQRATTTETTQAFNTNCRCKMTTHDVGQYGPKRRRKVTTLYLVVYPTATTKPRRCHCDRLRAE